jgi:hypothetical protein
MLPTKPLAPSTKAVLLGKLSIDCIMLKSDLLLGNSQQLVVKANLRQEPSGIRKSLVLLLQNIFLHPERYVLIKKTLVEMRKKTLAEPPTLLFDFTIRPSF